MAKPRVFVSSTYYDLKYIRASLDLFVDSLGFEPVLSEKGDIAYTPDRALDESCYREVENADMFILIVGGRYGSETSTGSRKLEKTFFDRYDSITKKEYDSAVAKDIPIYVLIEKGVYSEYQTFSRNKDVENIKYAHVDSVNVFLLIEDILAKPRNNPVHTFEKFEDIEGWLREQWAGLFRELLRRQSQQQQLAGLSHQVLQLKETNETLKKYLEAVMRGVGKQETSRLIESEERRLDDLRRLELLRQNTWVSHVSRNYDLPHEEVSLAMREASGFEDFARDIARRAGKPGFADRILSTLKSSKHARSDFNMARATFDLPAASPPPEWPPESDLWDFKEPLRPSVIRRETPVRIEDVVRAPSVPSKTASATASTTSQPSIKVAAKKASAKKSPAKKASAKKTPAKKAAAKSASPKRAPK